MSRAAQSKSRAEKKAGQSAPTPAVTHEIVPGKFNDSDWNKMVDQDDGEDFVADIMEELMSSTMTIIYNKYIEMQLLPYTLSQAKDAILTMLNWQFLSRDEGESANTDNRGWQEDEEPEPAPPDCWAQGSVPKNIIMSRTPSVASLQEESASVVEEQPEVSSEEQADAVSDVMEPDASEFYTENVEVVVPQDPPKSQGKSTVLELVPPAKLEPMPTEKKVRKPFKPYTGRIKSAGVRTMYETLDEGERKQQTTRAEQQRRLVEQEPVFFDPMPHSVSSILKLQPGRPPGNRDVFYDAAGNVISMAKLDPDKLPAHRIKTRYTVVDPAVDEAQARLEAMRTGRYLAMKKVAKLPVAGQPSTESHQTERTQHERATVKSDAMSLVSRVSSDRTKFTGMTGTGYRHDRSGPTPLPPPLLESMEVAPGVTVKEGLRVKRGQQLVPRSAEKFSLDDQAKLKPVATNLALAFSVKDFLKGAVPSIRMQESPMSPMVPRPPERPRGLAAI